MVRKIETSAQLNKFLEEIARELLEKVADEVLEDFQTDYLMKFVYEPNDPEFYKRTWQFFNSWRFTEVKKMGAYLQTELSSDKSVMKANSATFAHSYYSPLGKSSVEELEKFLNKDGRSSGHKWSRKDGQAYWDKFLAEYINGGKLKQVIDKHAKAGGLEYSLK